MTWNTQEINSAIKQGITRREEHAHLQPHSPISGRVRALNLTVPLGSGRVGSDDLGYGPGSGFSFEPVQISSYSLLCAHSFKEARAADVTHTNAHTHQSDLRSHP